MLNLLKQPRKSLSLRRQLSAGQLTAVHFHEPLMFIVDFNQNKNFFKSTLTSVWIKQNLHNITQACLYMTAFIFCIVSFFPVNNELSIFDLCRPHFIYSLHFSFAFYSVNFSLFLVKQRRKRNCVPYFGNSSGYMKG